MDQNRDDYVGPPPPPNRLLVALRRRWRLWLSLVVAVGLAGGCVWTWERNQPHGYPVWATPSHAKQKNPG